MVKAITYKNEADVKKQVKKILESLGVYYYMPVPLAYTRTGVPDFVCCYRGKFLAIETKFGYNKTSPRQDIEIAKIRAAGGVVFVINEKNITEIERWVSSVLYEGLYDVKREHNRD